MHELSVATGMRQTILKTAEEHGAAKVLSVHIRIGELSFVNPEQIEFWLGELMKGTIAEGAKILIETVAPTVSCPGCGYEGDIKMEDHPEYHVMLPSLTCPRCGGTDLDVKAGRDIVIQNIEAVVDDATAPRE